MKPPPTYDVFFFEAFAEEAEALRSFMPGDIRAGFTAATIQESPHNASPAPIISVRTQSELPGAWAGDLAAILSRSTGYDHLTAYRALTSAELALGYLPLYCARAVAEQAMLLWVALLRRLPLQIRHLATFERDGLTGYECEGRRLLAVGVGNIGYEIARIGKGLGMRVQGVDVVERHPDVDYTTLEAALPSADVVVCAMNLTGGNRGYFGYDTLKACRSGAIFVNVARGEFVRASDLLRLLDEGRLGGVGLDVYEGESALAVALRAGRAPAAAEARAVMDLARRPDAILTPHNAFNTHEAVGRKAAQSVEQIVAFRETGRFKWPVPPPA